METFPALLAICARNSPVPGEFPAQRPVTRSFDALICVWINGWVNNRKAGDLKRNRANYDVTVTTCLILVTIPSVCVRAPVDKFQWFYLTHLPPGQDARQIARDIFERIFLNEKLRFFIKDSLKFVRKGPIDNNLALI